ncbi:hypothetical protein Dimus_014136 [Dionaea muscipula]
MAERWGARPVHGEELARPVHGEELARPLSPPHAQRRWMLNSKLSSALGFMPGHPELGLHMEKLGVGLLMLGDSGEKGGAQPPSLKLGPLASFMSSALCCMLGVELLWSAPPHARRDEELSVSLYARPA